MPQKRSGFQSKPKFGGQKFGGKGKPRGKPDGGGFGKRFEGDKGGDKPRRPFGDRPESGGFSGKPRARPEGDSRPPREHGGGDRPYKKPFGDRPPRGDRPERSGGGDRPYKKPFGDRPPRGDRPERSGGGDRPYKKPFGDRPPRGDRPERSFGDRPPRGDRPERSDGDRPYKKPFGDRPPRGDRPERSFGDRPPRGDRPERSGGDKPYKKPFGDRPRGDRPERSFGDRPRSDRPDRGDRPFKPREGGGKTFDRNAQRPDRPQKTFTRYEDRPAQPEAVSFETRQKLKSDRAQFGAPSSAFLYGVHAVRAALLNPKRLHQRLLCTRRGFESLAETLQQALEAGIKVPDVTYAEKEDIERLLPRDAVHQDILLDCQPLEEVFLVDIINAAPENAKILVLDQVTDPHNVGAILRSAAAFGAIAVVAQKLHAPDITGTLAKAASGAAEHVTFVREVNLSRALEQLKEAGFFCIGLDEEGKRTISELKASGKVAIVLGSEGEGLRRLVAENCDELVRLPTQGPIASLNVSNAAAVALYEVVRV